ncbi:hypothetical protein TorRG33x02_042820 [Trema orientale]|uniref:Uncharacterized protein n=1 Tax=Trema orientale TaxID=63057 RepID=A0A2P5FPZ7_TREOI|nr:hypothetical protein TorRG33x02_042820 [Trema orientale]
MVLDESSTKRVVLDESGTKRVKGSIGSIFMHADMVDMCLMALGFVGSVFDGITSRLPMFFTSHVVNAIGSASTRDNDASQHTINKNVVAMLYVAAISWVACFLG